jgi:hypothetical protein
LGGGVYFLLHEGVPYASYCNSKIWSLVWLSGSENLQRVSCVGLGGCESAVRILVDIYMYSAVRYGDRVCGVCCVVCSVSCAVCCVLCIVWCVLCAALVLPVTESSKAVCLWPHVFSWQNYTGCNRRNGPNFGRVFLMLNYTDITQNTYVQS